MYFLASAHSPTKLMAFVKESSTGTVLLVKLTSTQYVAYHAARKASATGRYFFSGMWVMGITVSELPWLPACAALVPRIMPLRKAPYFHIT